MNSLRWTVVGIWLLSWAAWSGCSGWVRNSQEPDGSSDSGGLDGALGDPGPGQDALNADAPQDAGGPEDAGGDPDAGSDDDGPADGGAEDGDSGPVEVTPYKVACLAMSPDQEDLWIGTASGAARVKMATMEHSLFSTANCDIPSNEIVAMLADRQGDMWFGYGHASCPTTANGYCGLTRFNPQTGTWTTHTVESDGLLDDRVYGLVQAPDDTVWAGTYQGAIHNTVTGVWGVYFDWHDCNIAGQHCDPIWSYVVADFAFPGDQSMWLAIDLMTIGVSPKPGGVARRYPDFTTDTWKLSDGLPSHQATRIALVADTVWMGSPAGAAFYQPTTVSWQQTTSRIVNDVIAGPDGLAWLATEQGAMRRLPDESWEILTTPDGLPSERVAALALFGEFICFGTDAGVGCKNPSTGQWIYVH